MALHSKVKIFTNLGFVIDTRGLVKRHHDNWSRLLIGPLRELFR